MRRATKALTKAVAQRLKTASGNLEETLTQLGLEYSTLFEIIAPSLFQPMLDGVNKSTDIRFPTVEPSVQTMNLFDQAAKENLESVKNIPKDYVERIRKAVRKAVRETPGDTQALMSELSTIDGKTMRQAKNDALGLTRSLYQEVALQKAKSTGANVGTWIHSHGSKDPRHQHEEAHGHDFDLNTLIFLTGPLKGKGAGNTDHDNDPVKPGQAYGCKCTFRIKVDFGV